MTNYRVVSGRYSRLEQQKEGQETRQVRVRYEVGDTFTPTDEEIKKLGKQIEPVQGRTRTEAPAPAPPDEQEQAQEEKPDPYQAIKHVGGGNYELPNGEKVKGKEAAAQRLAELMEEEQGK